MVGVRADLVHLEAVAVGEADDVEPVACPAFAELRRREKFLDERIVRAGRIVLQKLFDSLRAWRQAAQVERQSPNQRPLVGERRRC